MIFNKFKKLLYGKSQHNREIIDTYANVEEKNKRVVLAISMYLIPFFYTYLFLILNGGIDNNRLFLYIPVIGLWFYIRKIRIKYELYVINNCIEREESSK